MSFPLPFSPCSSATVGKTVKITGSNAPASVSGTLLGTGTSVLVVNAGSVLAFVRISAQATPVATAADIPVLPGAVLIVGNPVSDLTAPNAAVLSSTTTACDVYFTLGAGQ